MRKLKLIRTSTVPVSLNTFCRGMLRELSGKYDVIALSSPGHELNELAKRENVRVIAVPMQRRINPLKDSISLYRLVRVFAKERPDIVHSMTPKAGLLCMLAGWITRVPFRIHTFTGLVFPTATGFKRRILILTDKITCACATHIIPEGQGIKNDLYQFHITHKPLQVLGFGNVRGVDLKLYKPKPIPHSGFIFLYVGRIAKDKGIKELVLACDALPKDAQLWLVGTIDTSDPVEMSIMDILTNHPQIHRYDATKNICDFYNQADCLILPSYREGFPNVVLEAGAMKLPCIVTDVNGSREIISNNVNGLIVPSHNIEQLRSAIHYMLAHPQEAKQMGENARPIIEQKYEQSYVHQCLYDYYDKIIE